MLQTGIESDLLETVFGNAGADKFLLPLPYIGFCYNDFDELEGDTFEYLEQETA